MRGLLALLSRRAWDSWARRFVELPKEIHFSGQERKRLKVDICLKET